MWDLIQKRYWVQWITVYWIANMKTLHPFLWIENYTAIYDRLDYLGITMGYKLYITLPQLFKNLFFSLIIFPSIND